MKKPPFKILIIGLFLSDTNRSSIQRTPADQLAESFLKWGFDVIKTSYFVNRIARLLDTLWTILFYSRRYKVAIMPFYGGYRSFVWEFLSICLLKLFRKKIIVIAHGGELPKRFSIKPRRYNHFIKLADFVVCPSPYLAKALDNQGINTIQIENIVKINEYTYHIKNVLRPHFLWMRAFDKVYDPITAIKVFERCKAFFPNAKMLMGGLDKGLLSDCKKMVNQLQLNDSILFKGYISLAEKNSYAQEYDIYLCTNIEDNAPISMIEMMALGMLVITTDAGGIPLMVTHQKNALISKKTDIESMITNIHLALTDNLFGKQIIVEARKTALKYDERLVMEKWIHLVNSTIE